MARSLDEIRQLGVMLSQCKNRVEAITLAGELLNQLEFVSSVANFLEDGLRAGSVEPKTAADGLSMACPRRSGEEPFEPTIFDRMRNMATMARVSGSPISAAVSKSNPDFTEYVIETGANIELTGSDRELFEKLVERVTGSPVWRRES